jgi:hypothetical protein
VAVTPIPLVMSESIEAAQATNGVNAVSNLPADVNASVEALDDLKRLLWRQFPDPVLARLQRVPEPYLGPAPTPESQPLQSLPMMSARAKSQVPAASPLPADLVHAAEPRWLDILGFLAGFGLSAAIGALLYVLLAAG